MTVATKEEFDLKDVLKDTARRLEEMQWQPRRDQNAERTLAEGANRVLHQADSDQFIIHPHVRFSRALRTRCHPQAQLNSDPELLRAARQKLGDGSPDDMMENPRDISERELSAYFEAFCQGTALGYPKLGDGWYILLCNGGDGADSGFFYIPVQNLKEVVGIWY